jgi:hypothetical protein
LNAAFADAAEFVTVPLELVGAFVLIVLYGVFVEVEVEVDVDVELVELLYVLFVLTDVLHTPFAANV